MEHIEYKRRSHKEIIAEIVSFNLQRRHLTASLRNERGYRECNKKEFKEQFVRL
jgi:hypothetical protein